MYINEDVYVIFTQMYSFVYVYVVNNCIYTHTHTNDFIMQISPQADLPNSM